MPVTHALCQLLSCEVMFCRCCILGTDTIKWLLGAQQLGVTFVLSLSI